MITDIVFFTGGAAAAEPTNYLQWVHSGFFAESGVVYAFLHDVLPPPQCKPEDFPALVARADFAPQARRRLEGLLRDRPAIPKVLSIQNFRLHKSSHTLAVQAALCRHFFPEARQRAIFVASPADREVEATCTRFLVYGYTAVIPLLLRRLIGGHFLLETSLALLEQQFGKAEITVIPYRNEEQVCREFAAALVGTLPDAKTKPAALPFTPSPVSSLLPYDTLAFITGVNQLFAVPISGQPGSAQPGSGAWSPHPWREFVPFLHGGTGSPQLIAPTLRAELQQKFDGADITALARRNLLPWMRQKACPAIPYKPFSGLTDEEALRLAGLLPQGHVETLLKGVHVPERYQAYGARQCLRALRRAQGGDASGASAARNTAGPPQPRVSILTVTYRHAPFIAECIESVIAQQTDFPFQHIIADDGSDDDTQDIIMDYAARYPHIVPIFQKDHPYGSENLRALFDMARTEYVALCDGDDYFTDPAKLQTQVALLDANPDCALCFHFARVVYEGAPERERLYPPEDILPRGVRPFYHLVELLRNNFIQTNTVLYRWRFRNGLPDWFRSDLLPGDRYWHLLHAERGKIGFINKVMSVYRRHEKSLFYLSEVDALKHRAKAGMREVDAWNVINKHFNKKYESIIVDMVNHIFADCLLYDVQQEENGVIEKPMLHKLSEQYPEFAQSFLQAVGIFESK